MEWLLAWYAARPALRTLVIRYLPFGSGGALDVALVAAQQKLLVKERGQD